MTSMRTTATIILLLACCCCSSVFGWAAVDRKTFWKTLGTAAAGIAFTPTLAANAFDPYTFNHQYDDPKHPNCKRIVVVKKDGVAMISGTENGKKGCPEDGSGEVWRLVGEAEGKSITVDFSLAEEYGAGELKGEWDENGIKWSDGNKWFIKGMMPQPEEENKEGAPAAAPAATSE